VLRKRKALPITDAELKLIARAAIVGDNSQPVRGYSTLKQPNNEKVRFPRLYCGKTLKIPFEYAISQRIYCLIRYKNNSKLIPSTRLLNTHFKLWW
jgi:hypothetical protein